MSKFTRNALLAAVAAVGAAGASQSQGSVIFLNMADVNPPVGGIMSFNGATMQASGGKDDLRVSLGAGVFPGAHMVLDSGWAVTTTVIRDLDGSLTATPGDTITANIGPSDFSIVGDDGVLVTGHFNNAVLNTSVGSSSVNINSATANGLTLSPGPVLVALNYPGFGPNESLGVSLVNISGPNNNGIEAAGAPLVPGYLLGGMLPFGGNQDSTNPTSGSVDMVATLVPEPASLGLLGLGALGLVARRRRILSPKLLAVALAGGAMMLGAAKSQASVMFMDLSDIHNVTNGLASYNGTYFTSLGDVDQFVISGAANLVFPNAHFDIDPRTFTVTSAQLTDLNLNGVADPGEPISGDLGPGVFHVVNATDGTIVNGTFNSATFSSSVGSNSLTINSANGVEALDLTAGPGLIAHGVVDLTPTESFGLNITGINNNGNGVTISSLSGVGLILNGTLDAWTPNPAGSPSAGSVNLVANAVTPEPATLGLLSVAGVGLVARRRRA